MQIKLKKLKICSKTWPQEKKFDLTTYDLALLVDDIKELRQNPISMPSLDYMEYNNFIKWIEE
jgi:hypothetical protein